MYVGLGTIDSPVACTGNGWHSSSGCGATLASHSQEAFRTSRQLFCLDMNTVHDFPTLDLLGKNHPCEISCIWEFPEIGATRNHLFNGSFVYKPSILGCPHLWKPPYAMSEPCYFYPPRFSGVPVLPEAGVGPEGTSAHTSSVGKQAWPRVNQCESNHSTKNTCKYTQV